MSTLLIKFIILNIVNVIIQTVKSIATVKCEKGVAAIANAIAYGIYTIVIVYMVCELPIYQKVAITGIANLIGVYLVKGLEEKKKKIELWKIEGTALKKDKQNIIENADYLDLSYNYNNINDQYVAFNFFCPSKEDSHKVKSLLDKFNIKYTVIKSIGEL